VLFERSPQPMWIYDRETLQFLAVNQAAIEHYGYTREEFLQMTIKDIRHKDDWPALSVAAQRIIGKHFRPTVWRHQLKNGKWIDAEITSNDETFNGRPARLVLIKDVTEQLAAIRALTQAKARYEAAARASGQVLFELDPETESMAYSGNAEEKLGLPKEGLLTLEQFYNMVDEDDIPELRSEVDKVLEQNYPLLREVRIRREDGSVMYMEMRGQCVDLDGHRRIIGFLADATPRRTLENQLLQAQKMEAVGQLAGGVAHDFNNMLGVILGYTEVMLMIPPSPTKLAENLGAIKYATLQAASLTRDLLSFSRRQLLQPQVVNLNTLLARALRSLNRVVTKEIHIKSVPGTELHNTKVDPNQLEQVLFNLVLNARDALPNGGQITVETGNVYLDQIYCDMHSSVRPGDYVMLAVSDNGQGMDSATLSRIFEPFFTTKEQGKGSGLGLAMVYGTVRQSGGHIWVYSEPGVGTTFKLYLPRVQEVAEEASADSRAPVKGGTESILVAEDEPAYRDLIEMVLKDAGYKVTTAVDGEEALTIGSNPANHVDLLLTDAVLPKLNGRKLMEKLQAVRPNLPVLFMSGYTTNVIVHHGMVDKGIDFLQKPVSPAALLRRIRDILDAHGAKTPSPRAVSSAKTGGG
jgi:two-component system cell cycle sensor histidine kinase/response regulator CckA